VSHSSSRATDMPPPRSLPLQDASSSQKLVRHRWRYTESQWSWEQDNDTLDVLELVTILESKAGDADADALMPADTLPHSVWKRDVGENAEIRFFGLAECSNTSEATGSTT
jgi:hypothetical protein